MSKAKKIKNSILSTDNLELTFTGLMKENLDFAFAMARRFLTNPQDIEDAIQSAFIKSWKSFQQFDSDRSSFSTWYYSILKNQCLDRLRQINQLKQISLEVNEPMENGIQPDDFENREIIGHILRLSEKLSPAQKNTFLLRDIHGLSVKEVAEKTRQTEGSVKTNVYHARKKMKEWLIQAKII